MIVTPLTALEAVNEILRNDGEAPVAQLGDTGFSESADAERALRSVSRQVQTKGFGFNTDYDRKFSPDVSNEIALPNSTLWVLPSYLSAGMRVVERARKLYDLDKNSYEFDAPVYLRVCQMLDFEELPSAARDYITIRAARVYQSTSTGSPTQNSFTDADETRAEATMLQADLRAKPRGYFRTVSGARSLNRRPY